LWTSATRRRKTPPHTPHAQSLLAARHGGLPVETPFFLVERRSVLNV